MRILVTIPRYFSPDGGGRHGSLRRDARRRLQALDGCLSALHQTFSRPQCQIQIARRTAIPAGGSHAHELDVVVCTTRGCHLLSQLRLPPSAYTHHPTKAEPQLLGFKCHAVLRERLGGYDYSGRV